MASSCIIAKRPRVSLIASWLVIVVSIAFVQSAGAQPTQNPTTAEFDPSKDHDNSIDGLSIVDRYEMDIFVQSNNQLVQTLNLGKPGPGPDGRIRINFAALLTPPLLPATIYIASVIAVGPGGRNGSAESNTFFTAPCTYTVSPTNLPLLSASGGSASVSVTTSSGCSWTASEAPWLTITSGAGGTGSGTVNYAAAANTNVTSRLATLTVAGQSVTVTQDAGPCTFRVSPTSVSVAAAGGNARISVATASGCTWTASDVSTWLSITSGASGNGNGTVVIAVTGNTTESQRTTTMVVAGQNVAVTQLSPPGAPKNFRIVAWASDALDGTQLAVRTRRRHAAGALTMHLAAGSRLKPDLALRGVRSVER